MEWFATCHVDHFGARGFGQLAPEAASSASVSSADARSSYAPLERSVVRELAMDRPASTSPEAKDGLERPVVIDPIDPCVIRLFGIVAWLERPGQESVG